VTSREEQIVEATEWLRRELMPEIDRDALGAVITEITEQLPSKGLSRKQIADKIAAHLSDHPIFSRQRSALERLIRNQPLELSAVLSQSYLKDTADRVRSLRASESRRPRAPQAESQEERIARIRQAKNRYERRRRSGSRGRAGSIETEFSREGMSARRFDPASALIGHPVAPVKTCLDEVLKGGEVPMVAQPGSISLRSLLGIGRKLLPRNLPRRRAGRSTLYGSDALLCCMTALLDADRWLVERDRRRDVLSGVIQRAREIGTSEIAAAVITALSPYHR
jgi:hypothetical protein